MRESIASLLFEDSGAAEVAMVRFNNTVRLTVRRQMVNLILTFRIVRSLCSFCGVIHSVTPSDPHPTNNT